MTMSRPLPHSANAVVLKAGTEVYRGSSLHGASHAPAFPPSPSASFYLTRSKDEAQEYAKADPHITWTYRLRRDLALLDQHPLAEEGMEHGLSAANDSKKGALKEYFEALAKGEAPSSEADKAALEAVANISALSSSSSSAIRKFEGIIRRTNSDYLGRVVEEILVPGRLFSVNEDKKRRCEELTQKREADSSNESCGQKEEHACPLDKPGDKAVFALTPSAASGDGEACFSLVEMLKCPPEKGKAE